MRRLLFQIIVSAGLLACVNGRGATTRELLSSMSQPIRDLGAHILRDSFVSPPRTNWDALMRELKLGMKESAVAELVHSVGATNRPGESITNEINKNYRLDDLWVLRCWFTNSVPRKSEAALAEAKLVEDMDCILVEPPPGFTGQWVTYWINGQVNFNCHYLDGKLDGIITTHYTDGSVCDVMSCHHGVLNGEATTYYRSGKIENKGQYRNGVPVGHWFWYHEDGKVESEKDFDKPGPAVQKPK